MKSIKFSIQNKRNQSILMVFCVLALLSCKKNDHVSMGEPVISGITALVDRDNNLESVGYGEWIIIKGKNLSTTYLVDFNSIPVADSLLFATDSSVTVKIPIELPDPINNPITITTEYGKVVYNFKVMQPPPLIESIEPWAAGAGEEITILGKYFSGVTKVKIGEFEATILEQGKNSVKVVVPNDETYGQIHLTTPVGTVTSEKVFGFRYIVYDNALTSTWWSGPWAGTSNLNNTTVVRRGAKAIEHKSTAGWGGAKLGKNAPAVDITGYKGLKVSLYGGEGTNKKKVKIYLNGVSGSGYEVLLTEGEWVDYQIPLSNLGNPSILNMVTLQEFSGFVSDFYIDDVGLY